ncbi:MAG: hypothetical protein LOD92_06605 [Bacillales bacterium]
MLEKSKAMESSTDMTTRQLMFSLIEVWKSSGKTQKEFCQEKDLAHHKFYYWLRKYNDHHRQSADESPFLSVSTQSAISSNLEIIYPDGRRLIFHQQVEAGFLRALLA